MGYLILRDYEKQIQLQNLDQIISGDPGLVDMVNQLAMQEMSSYLVQKYNTAFEFTDTPIFNYSETYLAADRFYLDFPAFTTSSSYTNGDVVSVGTSQYVATGNSTPGPFNPLNWYNMGVQYDMFYVKFPYTRFNYLDVYQAGNRVWWDNKVWECQRGTVIPDHESILQARVYKNIGSYNTMPGAANVGAFNDSTAQWGHGTPFVLSGAQIVQSLKGSVPAWSNITAYTTGKVVSYSNPLYPYASVWQAVTNSTNVIPGSDITHWLPFDEQKGDNRSAQMETLMADIALYHIHSRIAPRNVPELREIRYKRALEWLMDAAKGNVTPINLDLNQPEVGNRITFGGNVKKINSY
jgi:hypothetical protein